MAKSVFDSIELPALQSHTHCVLIPRDPNFIYAYWDYTEKDIKHLHRQQKIKPKDSQLILRVYDTTLVDFDGSNANHTWDLEVGFLTKSWYIHVWQDNANYCAELGIRSKDGHFVSLTRSNAVRTPPKASSRRNDLIWQDIGPNKESQPYIKENNQDIRESFQGHAQEIAPQPSKKELVEERSRKEVQKEKKFVPVRIYRLTAEDIRDYYMKLFARVSSRGRSKLKARAISIEDILKGKLKGLSWQKSQPFIVRPDLIQKMHPGASENRGASELLVSGSGGSEGRLKKREFFFEVWTELIVHGRTEPDAAVWLNEKGVKLNPDGTFSLRYALVDGEIPLKFIAQSSDAIEQRHINTSVEREKTVSFPKMLKDING